MASLAPARSRCKNYQITIDEHNMNNHDFEDFGMNLDETDQHHHMQSTNQKELSNLMKNW